MRDPAKDARRALRIAKAAGGPLQPPRKPVAIAPNSIANAVNVAKGIGRAIAPHPASTLPGIHLTAMPHPQDRVGLKDGGDPSIEHQPADETGFDAYHGSPHYIGEEGFQDRAIGTGEGAQAYGHGHYFAQNEDVAQEYKEKLSGHDLSYEQDPRDKKFYVTNGNGEIRYIARNKKDAEDYLSIHQKEGHLYHVRVHANPDHFLDWDKPLSEQRHVIDRIGQHIGDPEIVMQRLFSDPSTATGRDLHDVLGGNHKPKAVAAKLQEMGIPGIKYLDAGSRNPNTGEPTRNFVVFDPKRIQIKRRYARGGDVVDHALRVARAAGGRIGYAGGGRGNLADIMPASDPITQVAAQMQRTAAQHKQAYRPAVKASRDIPLPPVRPPELMTASAPPAQQPVQAGTAAQQVVDTAEKANEAQKDVFGDKQTSTLKSQQGQSVTKGASSVGIPPASMKQVMEMRDYLLAKGYTPAGAAAILGNGMQESGLSPNPSGSNDMGMSTGMFQWHDDPKIKLTRKTAFNNWVSDNQRDPSDWKTHLDYVDHDLKTNFAGLYKNLTTGSDHPTLTTQFANQYEAPNPKYANMDARLGYANSIFSGKSLDSSSAPPTVAASIPSKASSPTGSIAPNMIIAAGTNDWGSKDSAYNGIYNSIAAARAKNYEPVVVLPNRIINGSTAAYDGALAAANKAGVATEYPSGWGQGDDYYHMTPEAAAAIRKKYPDIQDSNVVGDSNAGRLGGKYYYTGKPGSYVADQIKQSVPAYTPPKSGSDKISDASDQAPSPDVVAQSAPPQPQPDQSAPQAGAPPPANPEDVQKAAAPPEEVGPEYKSGPDYPELYQQFAEAPAVQAGVAPPMAMYTPSDDDSGTENAKRGGYMHSLPPDVAHALEVLRKFMAERKHRDAGGQATGLPPGVTAQEANAMMGAGVPSNTLDEVLGTNSPTNQQIFGYVFPNEPPPAPMPIVSSGGSSSTSSSANTNDSKNYAPINSGVNMTPGWNQGYSYGQNGPRTPMDNEVSPYPGGKTSGGSSSGSGSSTPSGTQYVQNPTPAIQGYVGNYADMPTAPAPSPNASAGSNPYVAVKRGGNVVNDAVRLARKIDADR